MSKTHLIIRGAYFCISYDKRKSSQSYVEAVTAADPMDYAARLMALLPDFYELPFAVQALSLHQALVLARLLQLKVRSKAPPPSYKPEYIGGALRQLLVELKPFVRFDDDEHAQRIARGFENEVSQFYPIDCWFVVARTAAALWTSSGRRLPRTTRYWSRVIFSYVEILHCRSWSVPD